MSTDASKESSTVRADDTASMSRSELEAQVRQARRELGDALDELTTRLSPSYQAARLGHGAKQAAADVGEMLSGNGLPTQDATRSRNAKLLLGAVAVGTAAVAILVVRAIRR
ncbi:DUF3618 domain-containing protein [Isoptericola croceus]|uniref:DUF3618 domain-containing protein n=1 Tax=Isoptericola croceus TaxID=3031406 RepID=UPI0023F9CDF0|nr:DUF3618 domain-containing protein [Isoptericola croceus]